MLRYISIRLLYMIPVLWLVVSVVFLLIHLVPGDPIQQMLGEGATASDVQSLRHAYGLDVPIGQQYVNYWKGVLRGDLGRSLRLDQPVTRIIGQRYPWTLQLTIAAMIVALLISIPAGVRSARRRNRWDDRVLSFVSLLGLSFPTSRWGPFLFFFSPSNWRCCRSQAPEHWLTSSCLRSLWAARWPRFSPAWCVRLCWKS